MREAGPHHRTPVRSGGLEREKPDRGYQDNRLSREALAARADQLLALWVLRGRPNAQTRPITSLEDQVPGLRPHNVMVGVAEWRPGPMEPRSNTRLSAGPSDGHQTPIQIGAGQPLIRAGAAKPNLPGGPLKGGRRAGARLQTKSKEGRPNGRAEGYPLNGPGGASPCEWTLMSIPFWNAIFNELRDKRR